jgi:hypothetical protein
MVDLLVLGGWAVSSNEGEAAANRRAAAETLDDLMALGLGYHTGSSGAPQFDPAEVVNTLKWAGILGRHAFWRDRWIAKGRRMADDLAALETPLSVNAVLTRRFNLRHCIAGARSRLILPLPISASGVRILEVRPAPVDGGVTPLVGEGRVTTDLDVGTRSECLLAARVDMVIDGPPVPTRQGETLDLWLRPSEGFIRVSPAIAALAQRLSAGCSPGACIEAFWRYLMERFCLGVVRYDAFDLESALDWVLATQWFDCLLGSALLAALCRARGIPARLVGGNFLYPEGPTPHHWMEAWLGDRGWVPIDLAGWDLSAGGEDDPWAARYLGGWEPRLVNQRLPRVFPGAMSVRFPRSWQSVARNQGQGVETRYEDVGDGALIFADEIAVTVAGSGVSQARPLV